MNLKQKFIVLAAICGLLMAIISFAGYYTAFNDLEVSVKAELEETVEGETDSMLIWLEKKRSMTKAAGQVITAAGATEAVVNTRSNLAMGNDDADYIAMAAGHESGAFFDFKDGDISKDLDPRTRDWYKDAKNTKDVFFTEAYIDGITKTLVVSCIVAFQDPQGKFAGAICEDFSLKGMADMVQEMNYRGEGVGYIVQGDGKLLAARDGTEPMTEVSTLAWGKYFSEMTKNEKGFYIDDDSVIAYHNMPGTNWVSVIVVPRDFVYAPLRSMRNMYAIITIIGILLIVFACMVFERSIVTTVATIKENAEEMASGNLQSPSIEIKTSDELGDLAQSFNTMHSNLKAVISRMASTANQVAAASEELTANAAQSAEASVGVAETVSEVATGMETQLGDIDVAKKNVDAVFSDITNMSEKAKMVAEATLSTAEAAQKGQRLMNDAVSKMGNIEASVLESSKVVERLGENSQQIGQIVDAISAISEQTNLLALNAAIEAARAGEHGRGFAVVAEEVRKLAGESQISAEEIRQRIASIQEETAQAVKSMATGTNDVKEGTEAIRNVGTQFQDIMSKVEGITSQMKGIRESVDTVSQGATRIVEAVDSIDSVSRQTAKNTQSISASTEEQSASNQEIAAAAHSLSELAGDMQGEIDKFKY